MYHGDACEILAKLPEDSIGMSVFSPPFATLFSYSDSPRDLGNSRGYEEFFEHYAFIVEGLRRVMMPGRIVAVHCMDLPKTLTTDGVIGLRDFSGDMIRAFEDKGFIFHSRHVIWKDPLVAATRTKALGLAHKQIIKDSSMCRAGLPDFLIAMRMPGKNDIPISHRPRGFETYIGIDGPTSPKSEEGRANKYSHEVWRKYASPVWMDINQTRTLNYRAARAADDERHICPLQLDVIERALALWATPDDVVLSPFAGIGSEGYVAVRTGRRFIGIELKDSYYRQAVKHLQRAEEERGQEEHPLIAGIGD
jgi:hypothetical protein